MTPRFPYLVLVFLTILHAQEDKLPSFTTSKGPITNPKLMSRTETGVKLLHAGGIITLEVKDLPPEIATALGFTPSTEPDETPALPPKLTAGLKTYLDAKLVAVEPDGIRIQHSSGMAKVGYELLPNTLQSDLGGFNHQQAMDYRSAEEERAALAAQAVAQQTLDVARAQNQVAADATAELAKAKAAFNDPNFISPVVAATLKGYSQGGKSRNTSWRTDYGSYDRTDTSNRQLICTISSVSRDPQRAKAQAFGLFRNTATRDLVVQAAEDIIVTIPSNGAVTVGARISGSHRDANYEALGVRDQEGIKYIGWTWRLIDGRGRICSVLSSQPAYDRYAWQQPVTPTAQTGTTPTRRPASLQP